MNNRDYKIFAPNNYYHVFNRGVGKMDIFKDEADYRFFLYRFKENIVPEMVPFSKRREPSPGGYVRRVLPPGSFGIICYCLMPNHFHFLIKQNAQLPVSKLISKICTSYAKYFNLKYERIGSVFQGAFKAVSVDNDSYLKWLSAYIHSNPVIAGLAKNPRDYQWSSMPEYAGIRDGVLCEKDFILEMFGKQPGKYEQFVTETAPLIKTRKDVQHLLLE